MLIAKNGIIHTPTNMTLYKSPEYSCLHICNVNDDKVIYWICNCSKSLIAILYNTSGIKSVWICNLLFYPSFFLKSLCVYPYGKSYVRIVSKDMIKSPLNFWLNISLDTDFEQHQVQPYLCIQKKTKCVKCWNF